MPHAQFNIDEVARYLHVETRDVLELVKTRDIPFEKKGDRLLFRRQEIDVWASQRILGFSKANLRDYHKGSSASAQAHSNRRALFSDLMKPSYIEPEMKSKTRSSVLADLTRLADQTGLVPDAVDLLRSLKEREELCSTALAGGLALLHPRYHEPYMFVEDFILLGRTVQPVPFGAPDGQMTDLFFMICCSDDRLHLHALARVCAVCHQADFIPALRLASGAHELYDLLLTTEQAVIGVL